MGLLNTLSNVPEGLRKVQQQFDTGDRNVLEYIVGTGYEGVGKPVAGLLNVPIDLAGDFANYVAPETSQAVSQFVSETAQKGMEAIGADDALEWVDENIDPEYRRFANELIGTLGAVPTARLFRSSRPEAERGMALGSGNVIKRGHYNPEDVDLNMVERGVGSVVSTLDPTGMLRGQTGTNVANFYRQKKGTVEFLTSGLGRVASLAFNPAARAKYAEYGLTPVFDDVYKKYQRALQLPDGKERKQAVEQAVEEVSSQLQQMQHIRQQAGAKAKKQDATYEFALASADEFVPEMYFTPKDKGHDWYFKTTEKAPQPREVRRADAQFIQQHFKNAWEGDGYDPQSSKIIVKSPRSDVTGNHFRDVLGNNDAVTQIANMFQVKSTKAGAPPRAMREFESVDDLRQGLKDLQKSTMTYKDGSPKIDKKTGEPIKRPFSVLHSDDTGVWINMSKPGTAKVEGGVNMLIKVEPNGDLTGVMSDLHNFYEQKTIRGVTIKNVPMKRALPNEVLAITRPMQTNVVSISAKAGEKAKPSEKRVTTDAEGRKLGKFGIEAEERRIPQNVTAPLPERGKQKAAQERIERVGKLKGSKAEIARQSVPVALNAAMLEGMLTGAPEDDITFNP